MGYPTDGTMQRVTEARVGPKAAIPRFVSA